MELSPPTNLGCRLRVGARTMDRIVQRINDLGSTQALAIRHVCLTTMGSYFANLQAGYLNAYSSAQNRDDLQAAMKKAANNAQRRTLIELFGERGLEGLSEPQRTFIGVASAR